MSPSQTAAIAIACRMRYLDKYKRSAKGFENNSAAETEMQISDNMIPKLEKFAKENGGFPSCPGPETLKAGATDMAFNRFARVPKEKLEWSQQGCAFWVGCLVFLDEEALDGMLVRIAD